MFQTPICLIPSPLLSKTYRANSRLSAEDLAKVASANEAPKTSTRSTPNLCHSTCGTPQQHLEHVLLFAPNIQATSRTITNTLRPVLTAEQLSAGVIAIAQNIPKRSMQPLHLNAAIDDIYVFRSTML